MAAVRAARSTRCWHELAVASSRTSWSRAACAARRASGSSPSSPTTSPASRAPSTRIALTRLGAAREIADQYADELAADDARRGAFVASPRSRCTAVALVATQVTLGRLGYPGFDHGYSAALSLPRDRGDRVRLAGGARRGPPRRLARRCAAGASRCCPAPRSRCCAAAPRVALGGRRSCVDGRPAALYVVNFSERAAGLVARPRRRARGRRDGCAWWPRWRALARSSSDRGARGRTGRRPVRRHPAAARACAATRCGCALALALRERRAAITLVEWHAEHSLAEGLQRGIVEALAFERLLRRARPRRRRAALRPRATVRADIRTNVRSSHDAACRGLPAEAASRRRPTSTRRTAPRPPRCSRSPTSTASCAS